MFTRSAEADTHISHIYIYIYVHLYMYTYIIHMRVTHIFIYDVWNEEP